MGTEPAAFQRIALSLSGGGYRAAAFHLGTLDLLHRLGLLDKVVALSTVSGGTLCGARYAVSLLRGEAFEAFYSDFARYLSRTHALQRAVDEMRERSGKSRGRRRSIITGAADVYADPDLLGDVRLGALFDAPTHVQDWIFNATEFHTGLAFRFQTGAHPEALVGNHNVSISPELAGRARLADIAAASSCFPGAFEPLVFPNDFVWPQDGHQSAILRAGLSEGFPRQLALMDGGIYDNQGIDALMRAEERQDQPYDLFVISDSHRSASGFLDPGVPRTPRGFRLKHLFHAGETLAALSGISAVLLAGSTLKGWASLGPVDVLVRLGAVAVLFAVAGGLATGWAWLRRTVHAQIPEMSDALWQTVGDLRLGEVFTLVNLRTRSLLAMASDVFMKRVRGLSYERLFRAVGKQRVLSNLIYDLETAAEFARPGLIPTEAQLEVARRAGEVKTALWFDRGEEDLRDLVACGHSTLCLNLLQKLQARFGDDLASYPPHAKVTAETLRELWRALGDNPYALVR